MAGFHPIFVNELNSDAMATYLRNRPRFPDLASKYHVNDIKSLVARDGVLLQHFLDSIHADYRIDASKGQVDLVVGGPPCQGFSGIGHRRSYSVDKKQLPSNHLYEDFAYVVSRIRPKIFLFENVRGLLSAKWTSSGMGGEVWAKVKEALRSIEGYRTNWAEVRARDYGVPQNRPRVLFVGIRDDVTCHVDEMAPEGEAVNAGFLPGPTGRPPNLIELLGDLAEEGHENGGETLSYPSPARYAIQRAMRTSQDGSRVFRKGDPVSEHVYSKHGKRIVAKFRYMLSHDGMIPPRYATNKFGQRLLPACWGPEGPTITATSMPDDYVHYSLPRTLTVREWARLQCFPDWYEFSGKRTTGGIRRAGNPREGIHEREVPKYTQIGNAVPVLMAQAIGEHFRRILRA